MFQTRTAYRLSPQQRRIVNLHAAKALARPTAEILMEGPVDTEALLLAVRRVVVRHEALRTSIQRESDADEAVQVVGSGEVEDGLTVSVKSITSREHRLIFSASPYCVDCAALLQSAKEVIAEYRGDAAMNTGNEPLQYAQFSEWQNLLANSGDAERAGTYWRKHLDALLAGLRLPQERSQGHACTVAAVRVEMPALTGEEPAAVTLACWQALLWRLIRQPRVVVAACFDGRDHIELREGVGLYARYLPVLAEVTPELNFGRLLEQTREEVRDARSWLNYAPVDGLNSTVAWPAEFPYLFAYHEGLGPQSAGGVRFTLAGTRVHNEPFQLKLTICGSQMELAYDASRFSAEDVAVLAEQYVTVLQNALSNPNMAVLSLPLNSKAHRELLGGWRSQPALREAPDLIAWFERQAAQTPEAPALTVGKASLTYGELNARANRWAAYLRQRGIGVEGKVALCLERSLDMPVAVLAVLKAGAAYVPLDPEHPAERLGWMLEETKASLILTDSAVAHRLPESGVRRVDVRKDWPEAAGYSAMNLPIEAHPDNAAYVIYTSGSTGRPKGVVITRGNITRLFTATEGWYEFRSGDVWSMCHNYAFDVSVWEMWGAWLYGGKLVVVSRMEARSPELLLELLEREKVTVLSQTPSAFRQLGQHVERIAAAELKIRALVFAGESLDPAMLGGWKERYPETALVNMYGITETTVHSTYKRLSREETREGGRSPIGVEFKDLRTYLLNEDLGEAGLWETGELYLAGEGLGRCYLARPDLTAERFIPELEGRGGGGGRMYRSGDLARRRPDGEMEYVGRRDHQVKIRGYRVELGEIETAIRKTEGVRDAAVVVKGEGAEKRLVGYVFREADAVLEVETVRDELQRRVPDYMVPAVFLVLERMPLTANGKLDKRALPEPGSDRPDLKQLFVPPRNSAEILLAGVWSEVLGIDRIGAHDNYFVLGGDSIRSVRIVALAKKRGLHFSLQDLYQNQTIAELAGVAIKIEPSAPQILETSPFSLISPEERSKMPTGVDDAYPITMLQGGMLFHLELEPDGSIYHNVVSFNIEASFVPEFFQNAVDHVIARHAILRTSFDLDSYSTPLQLVHHAAPHVVQVVDIRGLSPERQRKIIVRHVEEERGRRFDIRKPPLLRFHIHRKAEDNFNFTITDCHAILDGWSLTSTIAEIFKYYFALASGETPEEEPSIAITYRDFVHLERQAIELPVFREFWRRALEGCRPTLIPRWPFELPDGPHNPVMRFTLPPELLVRLNVLARDLGVSLKSTLLAAHMKVLSLLTGQPDVMTGLSCHGRPEVMDGDRLRGNFLNTVPYRLQVVEGTWAELIRRTFAAEVAMLPYQRYPMATLQKEWGRKVFVETLFAVLNFHSLEQLASSGKMKFLSYGNVETSETNFAVSAIFWISPFPEMLPSTLFLQFTRDMGPAQIEAIGSCYLAALDAIGTNAEAMHSSVNLDELLAERDRAVLQLSTGVEELERSFSF